MSEITIWLDAVAQSHPLAAYMFLFVMSIAENLFPPVPGDTVTVFGAYLVGRGALNLWLVIMSTFLGSTVGFMILFLLGKRYGHALAIRLRWAKEENLQRASEIIARRGVLVVAANRFLPGLRSVITISAGIGQMETWKVLIATAVSVFMWNGLLIWAGMMAGRNWERVIDIVGQYSRVMLAVVACVVIISVVRHVLRRRNADQKDNKER
jgi:membrane protein DedA with SNARE-associated domain